MADFVFGLIYTKIPSEREFMDNTQSSILTVPIYSTILN